MFITTHTVVATTIAVKTRNPYLYIPIIFASHFILDALPHSDGILKHDFKTTVIIDAILGISFFIFFASRLDLPVMKLFLIDLLAGWPDLLPFYNKVIDKSKFTNFDNFHSGIQKFESKTGLLVEIVIIASCLFFIFYV